MFHVKALAWYPDGQLWVETLVLGREDALPALKHEFGTGEHGEAERFSPVHVTGLPPLTSYVAPS